MKNFFSKIISAAIVCFVFPVGAFAQTLFSSAYGTTDYEEIHDAEKSADGKSYFLTGISYPIAGDTYSFLIKMDTMGNVIWKRAYNSANHDVRFDRVFENSTGELIITGMFITGKQCGLFMKTDATGNIMELKRYRLNGIHKPTIVTREVVETIDHGYAMIGYAGFGYNDWRLFWMRTDSFGNPLYDHQYGNLRDDHPIALYRDDSSGFHMITRVGNSFNDNAGFVRAYDLTSTGYISSSKNIVPSFPADLTSCAKTPDGNYVLTGNSPDSSYVMKLNSTFDVVWIKDYSPSYFQSVTIDEDNSIWLTGRKYPEVLNTITKASADGSILFSKQIDDYCSVPINYDYYFSIPRSNVLCFDTKNIFTGYLHDCGIDTPHTEVAIMALSKNDNFSCDNTTLSVTENLGPFPEIIYQTVDYNDSVDFVTLVDSVEDYVPGNKYDLCPVVNAIGMELNPSGASLFPNPANDQLNIELSPEIQSISIYNELGQLIYHKRSPSFKQQVNCREWSRGIYLLVATDKDGRSSQLPFVVN